MVGHQHKILAMFPGQGSQSVGMARELVAEFPYVGRIFEEAEDASHLPLKRLCISGSAEELQLTSNQQPCLVVMSLAHWHVLTQEKGFCADYFAGHSLGEYSALVASSRFTLFQAVELVTARGRFMHESSGDGTMGMAAVIKAPLEKLAKACAKVATPTSVVEIANYNSPEQFIISGHKQALARVKTEMMQTCGKFIFKELPVSAPFHSSLMTDAKKKMELIIQPINTDNFPHNVIANVTGDIAAPYSRELLIKQINHPVLWLKSLETAQSLGVERFVEIGPGSVLSGLAKRSLAPGKSVETTSQLRAFLSSEAV